MEEEAKKEAKGSTLLPGQTVWVKFPKNDVLHTQFPKGTQAIVLAANLDSSRISVSITNANGLQVTMVATNESSTDTAQWSLVPDAVG